METINIFLASSKKLDYSRMAFGNLIRRLDDIYEKRGIRVKLFEWEDYDAAYNGCRKQDEYNDQVRKSDMFVALFLKDAYKYTLEEFEVALDEFRKRRLPRIYVYCKDIPKNEVKDGLKAFMDRLENDLQYYCCRYGNRDGLQFHFVMQFLLFLNKRMDELKVEDGTITLAGLKIAKMDRLKFASGNQEFIKMRDELALLPQKIEKTSKLVEKHPEDEDLRDDLQRLLERQSKLRDDFNMHQQLLLNTAKHIAQLEGKRITKRMRDAIDALNEGKVHKANCILEDVEEYASRIYKEFKQNEEITEQKRQLVICSIEELQLKASTLMADESMQDEGRILQVEGIYAQADEMAQESSYDKEKHVKLLYDYFKFLYSSNHGGKTMEVAEKLVQQCEETYGKEHPFTIHTYNTIGEAYLKLGEKAKAQEYFDKAKK